MTEGQRVRSIERHTQTILVLVLVALLLWVGGTVQSTSVEVAAMGVEIRHLQAQIEKPNAKFFEIEKRLDAIERQLGALHNHRVIDPEDGQAQR